MCLCAVWNTRPPKTYSESTLWSSGFWSKKSRISIKLWLYLKRTETNTGTRETQKAKDEPSASAGNESSQRRQKTDHWEKHASRGSVTWKLGESSELAATPHNLCSRPVGASTTWSKAIVLIQSVVQVMRASKQLRFEANTSSCGCNKTCKQAGGTIKLRGTDFTAFGFRMEQFNKSLRHWVT